MAVISSNRPLEHMSGPVWLGNRLASKHCSRTPRVPRLTRAWSVGLGSARTTWTAWIGHTESWWTVWEYCPALVNDWFEQRKRNKSNFAVWFVVGRQGAKMFCTRATSGVIIQTGCWSVLSVGTIAISDCLVHLIISWSCSPGQGMIDDWIDRVHRHPYRTVVNSLRG